MARRARSDVLGMLHEKLAHVMLEALDGETIVDEEGNEIHFKANNPALFTAVARFLKDNNIIAVPDSEDAIEALKDKLKQQGKTVLPAVKAGDAVWHNEKVPN